MHHIEIPSYEPKTKVVDGNTMIFDPIRKKYLILTPEELIRQGVIKHLVDNLKYPRSLFSVEKEVRLGKKSNRCDIHIMRNGAYFMVVECKSFKEKINQAVFDQASKYCSVLKADYLVVTNGEVTYCCQINHSTKEFNFIDSLPDYPPA